MLDVQGTRPAQHQNHLSGGPRIVFRHHPVRRFHGPGRQLRAGGIARSLKQLESAHIVTRVPYQEPGSRARDEYRLTEAGEDLLPVFLALVQWGDKHLQKGPAPLSFIDADTGQPVEVRVTTDTATAATCSADIEIRRSGLGRRR